MRVDLDEVIEAIENASDYTECFYYVPDEIIFIRQFGEISGDLPEDFDMDEEEDNIIPLPSKKDINDYENMEKYIAQLTDERAAEWLANAIKGKGAFRRFRATLQRFNLEEDWYDFLDERHRQAAIEWCERYGIAYDESHPEIYEDLPREIKPVIRKKEDIRIVRITKDNYMNILLMVSDYFKELNKIDGLDRDTEPEGEPQEWTEDSLAIHLQFYAASISGRFIGFMVYGDDGVVEALYVRNGMRRKGIATQLIQHAEETAGDLLFNVYPGNRIMLKVLESTGYRNVAALSVQKEGKDNIHQYIEG
ncbi:MAG: GNAT family N-acetyltransferase [Solobacterium sp.]|nr:GNAT family N-acetyltransferase [Solobacterium sp.]